MNFQLLLLYFLKWFIIFILSLNCKSSQDIAEEDFLGKSNFRYSKPQDPNSKIFLQSINPLWDKVRPYKGDFRLTIQTTIPKKQIIYLDGKVFCDTNIGYLKIQLMDQFMGLVFSEIWANSSKLKIMTSGNPSLEQGMGDIQLIAPDSGKSISLPFPVIYQLLTGEFRKELESKEARFLVTERRILIEKPDGIYEYFFTEKGLTKVELKSEKRGYLALSSIKEPSQDWPPKVVLTQVKTLEKDKEVSSVLLEMRSKVQGNVVIEKF